jgi:diguanylate cyclase (GGDEF)-like protein
MSRSTGSRAPWVRTAALMAVLLAVYGSWQLFHWTGRGDRQLAGELLSYPFCIAAVCTAWRASQRCSGWPRLRLAWRMVALASFSGGAGVVATTAYELIGGPRPYPSVGDVVALAFYPLLLCGLLLVPVARRTGEHVRLALDLAVVVIGGSAVVVYVVLGPTAVTGGASTFQAIFTLAKPVGDMVLLLGLASLLLRRSLPSAHLALTLMAGALLFYVASDLIIGYMQLHGGYETGDPVDTLTLVALAFLATAGSAQGAVSEPERITSGDDAERVGWVPYAAVAAGFAVLLVSQRHQPFFPDRSMSLIAVVLAILVAARQFLGQRDLLGAQGRLRHQALHDGLTGLPNRTLVLDRADQMLARARRDLTPVAALYIDVDGFKHVNDTFGHAAGDELLITVAGRLSSVVREGDTVGRLGGDEFVVLLDAATLEAGPDLVVERILDVLRQPVALTGTSERPLVLTASIGLAVGQRVNADQLLRDADLALYEAKAAGKDRYVLFESSMQTIAEDRHLLELDLRDALGSEQFFLLYQPTFDLKSEAVTGVEALIRWRHPGRGVVPPDQFIPIAEQTGLIVPIGRWVLLDACRQAAVWHANGHPIGIAVNVSACQLETDELVRDVQEALAESGLEPTALTLEITETTLMRNADEAARRLTVLKTLGIRVAVDDFGTGYSSLAYLRQFPVDSLKIDRSFISGSTATKESAALIHTLVQLGKSLGLQTVGEGIEETSQLRHLQQEGCDLGQGYLLARPLEADAIERFLTAALHV